MRENTAAVHGPEPIPDGPVLRIGMVDARVPAVRKRLERYVTLLLIGYGLHAAPFSLAATLNLTREQLMPVLQFDTLLAAFLPAGLYLVIHLIEGELVTPMLLARRFTLNPVLIILALIFWFWLWGAPGAILAVPMLAILKIICDGVGPLNNIGRFLEA